MPLCPQEPTTCRVRVFRRSPPPEVRSAQRPADCAYRLAVDPQPANELRLFGLAGWTVERFISRRKQLFELQYRATRLREKPVIWCMIIVIAANAGVFGALGFDAVLGACRWIGSSCTSKWRSA
jgi:ATP-binding cassette, subfamily B, bacterial